MSAEEEAIDAPKAATDAETIVTDADDAPETQPPDAPETNASEAPETLPADSAETHPPDAAEEHVEEKESKEVKKDGEQGDKTDTKQQDVETAENQIEFDLSNIDMEKDQESDVTGVFPVPKNEDEAPVPSVSFPELGIKESLEQARKSGSVTSVMSYDSVTSVDETETKARLALGSIISIGRRGSGVGGEYYDRHRMPKFMNSYKLEPDKPFHVEKVEKCMREILTEALENSTYDIDKTPKQAKWASSAMRAKLKEQEYDRCKFICIVTMGEKRSQDVHSIFRFLWDPDRDKYAHVIHENMSVFAVAVCFGIYYE